MPSIVTEVSHSLGKATAVERLTRFVEQLHERYATEFSDMQGQWSDNQLKYGFTTRGLKIHGTLTVEESSARVDCHLPFAALLFRGKIEKEIRSQLEQMLRPANSI